MLKDRGGCLPGANVGPAHAYGRAGNEARKKNARAFFWIQRGWARAKNGGRTCPTVRRTSASVRVGCRRRSVQLQNHFRSSSGEGSRYPSPLRDGPASHEDGGPRRPRQHPLFWAPEPLKLQKKWAWICARKVGQKWLCGAQHPRRKKPWGPFSGLDFRARKMGPDPGPFFLEFQRFWGLKCGLRRTSPNGVVGVDRMGRVFRTQRPLTYTLTGPSATSSVEEMLVAGTRPGGKS